MIRCVCLVQQDQAPDTRREALTAAMQGFTDRAFGDAADVSWIAVGSGNGFTAGSPSTSSVVSVTAPKPLDQPQRVELLKELCELWIAETGCSLNEIVASVSDPK